MNSFLKLTMLFAMNAAIAGCSTFESIGDLGGNLGRDDTNFAAGSPVSAQLSGSDRDRLADAFNAAMETGEVQNWRGRRAGGSVTPLEYSLGNILPHPDSRIAAARRDLDLAHVMETDLGLYVLTRNTNVRTGPGTENAVAEVLPSGAGVDVVGRVVDEPWMLVAADDRVRGYVFQNLLIKAPGTELELAGGPERRPVLCREFSQRLATPSQSDEWTGAACHDGAGWRLAAPEPELLSVEDEELAGF